MGTRGAPIFSPAWEHRRKLQVRLPEPDVTKFIGLMLADPFPFFINIFDTAEQFAEIGATTGEFGSKGIAAQDSAEQRANVPEDYWLLAPHASISPRALRTSFSFQPYHPRRASE